MLLSAIDIHGLNDSRITEVFFWALALVAVKLSGRAQELYWKNTGLTPSWDSYLKVVQLSLVLFSGE